MSIYWNMLILLSVAIYTFELPTTATAKTLQSTRVKRYLLENTFPPQVEQQDAKYWKAQAQTLLQKQLQKNQLNKNRAKNVIFFLGDGMSISTLTTARVYMGGESQKLSFEEFPYAGLVKTYCANAQVADSACSATAYLGGVKANYGTLGVSAAVKFRDCIAQNDPENHVDSILAWAQKEGKATGLVTTTEVTDATPAAAYAHTSNSQWYSDAHLLRDQANPDICADVANQMVRGEIGQKLNVILGGGRENLLPKTVADAEGVLGNRVDGVNLIEEWQEKHNHSGIYVTTKNELKAVNPGDYNYILGLFSSSEMPYHLQKEKNTDRPSLEDMVSRALDLLENNERGFVLFAESGLIDRAHHESQAQRAIDETVELHKAVKVARERTSESETLILVTADHSHTMTMSGYSTRDRDILGTANAKNASDQLPYSILSYANGPGYKQFFEEDGSRKNLSEVDMQDQTFRYPAAVPITYETHAGEDVALFASEPWAHLFTGNYEQHLIPHVIGYAACIGEGLTVCNDEE